MILLLLDEAEADGEYTVYHPEAPAAEEDSQMSFNAEQFFQTNFQVSGDDNDTHPQHDENGIVEYEAIEGAVIADGDGYMNNIGVPDESADVINNDLQLSESDEDMEEEEAQPEGVGFDFDEFDA